MKSTELKKLNTELNEKERQLDNLKLSNSRISKEITAVQFEIKKLKDQMDNVKSGKVVVSEHALLRYLERFREIDLNLIEDEIISKIQPSLISSTCVVKSNGVKYVIKDNVVVTIVAA